MIVGVPKEIKDHETRVGITPAGAKTLVDAGHMVLVEASAGELSAFPDSEYIAAGAEIIPAAAQLWAAAELIVKVKEPVPQEFPLFRDGLALFTYLHLAPAPELTDHLLDKKITGIAYETIRDKTGALPLLTPMSEVAGRMSVQVGATYLQTEHGGRGLLLGGVPGVPPASVCVIGGGIVGTNAGELIAEVGLAIEMGADAADIGLTIHAHPTLSETVAFSAEAFEGTLTDLYIPKR